MKKRNVLNVLLLSMLLISFACGKKTDDSKEVAEDQNEKKFEDSNREKDTEFAVDAADGGMMEVQLGQLAQTNGSNAQIKAFGQMMIDDHSKANDELKALAAQKNISLPSSLSDKCMKKYNDLAGKKGTDFDKDYIDLMVSDHKDDIDAFKKEAEKGNDTDVKTWASGKLSVLEHHLQMAEQAKDATKNNH